MRYFSWVPTGLLLAMLLASLNSIALGKQPSEFNISIDEQMRSKWGAEYPVTYGQHVFEFILPCGYQDDSVYRAATGEFLFVRDWNGRDNPASTDYVPWNSEYRYYGIGGDQTKSYDAILEARRPKGRYYAEDVAALNRAFDTVYRQGGIFYAMFHADRYQNSVLYDPRPGVEGVAGSTLMQHFSCVANRRDVWYVANGWLYCYRHVAEHAKVARKE